MIKGKTVDLNFTLCMLESLGERLDRLVIKYDMMKILKAPPTAVLGKEWKL